MKRRAMVAAIVVLAVLTILSYFGIGATNVGAPSPSPTVATTPSPVTTGIVTATFADGRSSVGRFASAHAFVPCASATTQPFTNDDLWRAGGECGVADADAIARAIATSDGGILPLVNSVALSNDRSVAVATFVRAATTGQALLLRRGARWSMVARSEASGIPLDASLATAGVPAATVAALQSRLAFDVATPSRRLASP